MDKNKLIQNATRYTQRGQIERAIGEYERIVAHDPTDVRALLKIGELQQRQGQAKEAGSTLQRVAETYADQGFFLKAVAVYKQVLKLAPSIAVNQRLADLYQQLGLLSDAMGQLQLVASAHEKEGRVEDTIAVLRKIMDLDPENLAGRIRLGEYLAKAGQEEEALQSFEKAATALQRAGRTDDHLRVIEKILALRPDDLTLARKLAGLYLDKGDARRALARLQHAFKVSPDDAQTLDLLARAFGELRETAKQVAVYKELARVHRGAGRGTEERKVWETVLRLAPGDAAAASALGRDGGPAVPPPQRSLTPPPLSGPRRVPPAPSPTPSHGAVAVPGPSAVAVPAPSAQTKQAPPQAQAPAGSEDRARLLAEVDVYLKYKLYPKAEAHLQGLLASDPGSLDVQERVMALAEATGDESALRQSVAAVLRLSAGQEPDERGRKALSLYASRFSGDPELAPLAAALEGGGDEVAPIVVETDASIDDELVLAVSVADEPLLLDSTDAPIDVSLTGMGEGEDTALRAALELTGREESVLEDETFSEPLLDQLPEDAADLEAAAQQAAAQQAAAQEAAAQEAAAQEAAAQEAAAQEAAAQEAAAQEAAAQQAAAQEAAAQEAAAQEAAAQEAAAQRPAALDPAFAAAIEADLEEASFYEAQGMEEEAVDLLRSILERAPGHPLALAQLEALGAAQPSAPAASPAPATAPPPLAAQPPQSAPAPQAPPPPKSGPIKTPPPPTFGGKVEPLQVPEQEATFDLAAELMDDLGLDEEPAQDTGAEFQYSVEEVLAEFKKGVSQTVRPEDSETHYNLGIAYKEMGLHADAISQFELAGAASAGSQRELDCLLTMGLCHGELGNHGAAIEAFQRGLGAAAVTAEAALALHYEIGASHEALGDVAKALDHYERVERVDPRYRGVGETLERLRPKVKNGKVGYV